MGWKSISTGGALDRERLLREVIAASVLRLADANGGYLTRDQLGEVHLPDGTSQRLVDPGKGGIWNPREFAPRPCRSSPPRTGLTL